MLRGVSPPRAFVMPMSSTTVNGVVLTRGHHVHPHSDLRASISHNIVSNNGVVSNPNVVYNSSNVYSNVNGVNNALYKSHDRLASTNSGQVFRREYGSQGAIDAISNDVRIYNFDNNNEPASPRASRKKVGSEGKAGKDRSIFKKLRVISKQQQETTITTSSSTTSTTPGPASSTTSTTSTSEEPVSTTTCLAEDRHRRRFFVHHDVISVCASMSGSSHLRRTLERRNTTTGASAAVAALRNGSGNEESGESNADNGDHVSNDLVLSCPYFRNEIGGEGERRIALSRTSTTSNSESLHPPSQARGLSLLHEPLRRGLVCPYASDPSDLVIERVDKGAAFYKEHFYNKEHQNWFGIDETLGPVAISLRRERFVPNASPNLMANHNSNNNNYPSMETTTASSSSSSTTTSSSNHHGSNNNVISLDMFANSAHVYFYRLLIRTSERLPLRGCVMEESVPALKAAEKIKTLPAKEVLEFVCPELQLSCLRLGTRTTACEDELVRLDEAYVQNKYKVGLMYCRAGQQSEEEMYNNEEGGEAFNEFLDLIGQKVRLKGFNKYKAGLCNKNDSTGLYSVYTEHEGHEIMFHVSTLLPFTPNNRQQLPRKRYIGNDIVTVVFQEPGALPFIPNIKSQFQHVFIVVRVHQPCSDNTTYSVAVTRSKSVPSFGPAIPSSQYRFPKSKSFVDFLLTKIINAENAAHNSDKFVSMAVRTRQELLKDLATNHVTQTTLDSGSKFNLFGKKKEKNRARFVPDPLMPGALTWRVVVEDNSRHSTKALATELDAFLALSSELIVLVQDHLQHETLFSAAIKTVIGWTALHNSIRIYFHHGEALVLHSKDWESEDMAEIAARLRHVSDGAATQEFTLRRNQLGQLGFHVQHDGIITEVENFGYAWQTGLRQGSRLVEINKQPVSSLSHEQMVELLKTSLTVTVTVIPPYSDASPRRGCHLKSCKFASFGAHNDLGDTNDHYDNIVTEGIVQRSDNPVQQWPRRQQWYELDQRHSPPNGQQQPPVLPVRLRQGNKGSAFRTVSSNNGVSVYQQVPQRVRPVGHAYSNVHFSNGTNNVVDANRVQSNNRVNTSNNKANIAEERRCHDAKVTYLTDFELNNQQQQWPTVQHERLTALRTRNSPLNENNNNNQRASNHSEESSSPISERSHNNNNNNNRGGLSDEELSAVSNSSGASPSRAQRRLVASQGASEPALAPSSSSSRASSTQSPRPSIASDTKINAAVKKRALTRLGEKSQRNSSGANLQDELIRLINPDDDEDNNNNNKMVNGSKPSANVEPFQRVSETNMHVAQPAKVVSQMNSSRSSSSLNSALNDRSSLKLNGAATQGELEWSTLVHTASRVVGDDSDVNHDSSALNGNVRNLSSRSSSRRGKSTVLLNPSSSVSTDELLCRLSELETKLTSEARERVHLEEEVAALRQENVRLQEESQSASQQLKRFTEWFFQTIDKNA